MEQPLTYNAIAMFLEIVTPDKQVYSGDVQAVRVPGSEGAFEMLDRHASIISPLINGEIRITTKDGEETFQVQGGVVESLNNKTVILAEAIVE